jgi:tetratricopeptide (TPR) repeat protein
MVEAFVKKDPLNLGALRHVGFSYIREGKYNEARNVYRKMLEINPAFGEAYVNMGCSYLLEGNYHLAYENYDKAKALLPENNRTLAKWLIITLATDNKKSEALKEFQKFKELNKDYNTNQAEILFALGDADEAFRRLEIAYDQHEPMLVYLRTDITFDKYRSDKRFQALMQKMNFPQK